jgi:lysophospholipase L1-like esterase
MPSQPTQTPLSPRRQAAILVLINLLILAGLLYGLEFYLALTDPRRTLPPEPEEVRNSYGFREKEFAASKSPGVCRIMALGDSFTWGKGVWVKERYTSVLQGMLTQAYPQKNIEVLNFGFPGAPTTRERDALRQYKAMVQPNLLLVGFVLNDPQPRRHDYSIERDRFEEKYGEIIKGTAEAMEKIKLSHVAALAVTALENFLISTGVIPTWEEALDRVYQKNTQEWRNFEQALRDIKSMSDEMDLPQPIFAVLNQGTYTDRPTDYNHPDEELQLYLRWYHQAEGTAAQLGFNPINYEQELAQQMTTEPYAVTVLDGHPSARVHRIYAEKLFKEIAGYIESGQLCP